LLIGGVILGPIFSDVYRYCYPSQESVALSDLGVRVEDINKGSEERDRVQNQKLNEMLAIQGNEKLKMSICPPIKTSSIYLLIE